LLHFLLLGAVIFAAFDLLSRHKADKPSEIVITQGTLENLVTGFTPRGSARQLKKNCKD
jgi:hypothetical protein